MIFTAEAQSIKQVEVKVETEKSLSLPVPLPYFSSVSPCLANFYNILLELFDFVCCLINSEP